MSIQEKFEKIQSDFSNLDAENMGNWPLPVKVVCWLLVMLAVVAMSYQVVLQDQSDSLNVERQKEITLKSEFEQKVQDAANIEAYRSQMKEMKESFSALLAQLPKDTEVPGLLDDISEKGLGSGLSFQGIDLQQEKKADFYIELPINIKVKGGYHDFGTFVSGVAGLPRIVTLHDFVITPAQAVVVNTSSANSGNETAKGRNNEELAMQITAKTYRYKASDDDSDGKTGAQKNKGGAQ